jgi:ADP-ribose pyrophosphatase YjhB (NUDIX family)
VLSTRSGDRGWMSTRLWNHVKRHMSIPCVDVILENRSGEILLGWRKIEPYRNVWALPGGRISKGEDLQAAAQRILAEYKLSSREFYLVGVFPISFPSRSDLSICLASRKFSGEPKPDGAEFSTFRWTKQLPTGIGANYRRMITRWRRMKRKPQVHRFALVDES